MNFIGKIAQSYNVCFSRIERLTDGWLLGLTARLIFASVLLVYFINSAKTKVTGATFPDFLIPGSGAYAQILPTIAEHYNYDAAQIPFFPYKIIVFAGTYAEFILPALIVLGLLTRLSSLAMIGFIAVMTYVDIYFHKVEAKTIGAFFDTVQDSAIADQRLLWIFPLIYLVLNGPGLISCDALFCRTGKQAN